MSEPVPGQEDFDQQGRTFRLEVLRALPNGFVDTAYGTFVVFLAVNVFDLPDNQKAGMVAAASVGLLLSLFVVQLARRLGKPVNFLAAALWTAAACGFSVAALSEGNATLYATGCCMALTCMGMGSPLIAQIYRKHYPNEKRGSLFSVTALVRAASAGTAAWLVGDWLVGRNNSFSPLFWGYACACLIMAGCVLLMAPVVLSRSNRIRWFEAFRHVGEDRAFLKLLVVWMMFGFGNLAALALFVEFITNVKYGYGFDAERVGLITSTIPMAVFIVCVVPWGFFFDRLPFYTVRVIVNLFFLSGILTYYLGGSFLTLCIGIGLHGIARSGGNILWTLWVTRFADGDRVVEYMSVHSFLTGIRGIIAPFFAYYVASSFSPLWVCSLSGTLIVLSGLAIVPEIRQEWTEWKKKPA